MKHGTFLCISLATWFITFWFIPCTGIEKDSSLASHLGQPLWPWCLATVTLTEPKCLLFFMQPISLSPPFSLLPPLMISDIGSYSTSSWMCWLLDIIALLLCMLPMIVSPFNATSVIVVSDKGFFTRCHGNLTFEDWKRVYLFGRGIGQQVWIKGELWRLIWIIIWVLGKYPLP
jgi:hypothetical protein